MAARTPSCPSQASTPTLGPHPLGQQQEVREEVAAMVTTNDLGQLINYWVSRVSSLSDATA